MEDDLPAMDLEALDRYLCSDRAPDHCMALSGLDGFLTAVVIAPDRIPPSEWLPVIWGDEEPEFESEAELRTILATIMGRYSQIATCFESDPDDFDPIFREGPRGDVVASDWAAGFLDAVAMRREAWEPMIGTGGPEFCWRRCCSSAINRTCGRRMSIGKRWRGRRRTRFQRVSSVSTTFGSIIVSARDRSRGGEDGTGGSTGGPGGNPHSG
jgi:yecA family protein